MQVRPVKRRRVPVNDATYSPSQCSVSYFIRNGEKKLVQVCVAALSKILHLPKSRFQRISKQFYNTGYLKEQRGGTRPTTLQKYNFQKDDIREFVVRLKFKENHYCRSQNERKYLSSDLNIEKLYKMYTSWSQIEDTPKSPFTFNI